MTIIQFLEISAAVLAGEQAHAWLSLAINKQIAKRTQRRNEAALAAAMKHARDGACNCPNCTMLRTMQSRAN